MAEVLCLECKTPAELVYQSRDVFRRLTLLDVWCHGAHQVIEIGDTGLEHIGDLPLRAFARPVLIIEDRDRGDEDPNEPWQGKSCQM